MQRNERPRRPSQRKSDRPRSDRSRSDRPRSDKPRSDRPRSDHPRTERSGSDRPRSDRQRSDRPRSDRPRSDRPRTDRTTEKRSFDKKPFERKPFEKKPFEKKPFEKKPGMGAPHQPRARIFEPELLEEITGENLDKSVRAELLSLSAENGKYVSRHLESIAYFSDIDPERAYQHGLAAAHHAGRLAIARESAGYAAYRAGHYEIALRELRAAHRISGDVSMWPVMADCERGLGNPFKALKIAGSPEVKRLGKAEEIEMRIVAAGARRDLGEVDAAIVTLQCRELNNEKEPWAVRLRYAYADALHAAGRADESRTWFRKCADVDFEGSTDAAERASSTL